MTPAPAPQPARDPADILGRLLMVGVRGATPDDPALREDLDACREARCRAVILFDVDLPSMGSLRAAAVPDADARARATRNILSPDQLVRLTAHIRATLGPDTIIAVDQEGGRVARLSPSRGFPQTLAAFAFGMLDDDAQEGEAAKLAGAVGAAGINLNFAPCVDLASNPDNPIIAKLDRAYGARTRAVVECAECIIHAQTRAGVMSCIKHFPGHGSSSADSHLDLPDITRTYNGEHELAPYHELRARCARDPLWVMTAHLLHRAIDPDLPASLSRAHTTNVLRKQALFDGPVITDSLDMRAIADRFAPDEAALLAINAGADVLLDANNSPGKPRPCPAPALAEAVARALRDNKIPGGLERLRISAQRVERALGALPTRETA